MVEFKPDIDRDAIVVAAAMAGGFEAACYFGMFMPDFAGGPDSILAHGEWLKAQPEEYISQVVAKVQEIQDRG